MTSSITAQNLLRVSLLHKLYENDKFLVLYHHPNYMQSIRPFDLLVWNDNPNFAVEPYPKCVLYPSIQAFAYIPRLDGSS